MSQSSADRFLKLIENAEGIDRLLALMSCLRNPNGGCPWDIEQSYQSILPFTIEEVYEVAEAIENQDYCELKDELGDLLFQVVFYAQIAKEEGHFEFSDVVDGIVNKLVRRHPHVFANEAYEDEASLKKAWESQKHKERQAKDEKATSLMDDIPKSLPELKRAHKIQKRVAKVGFDWENTEQVWEKIFEEVDEVKEAEASGKKQQIEEEIGDLLFALVNLGRHHKIDPDMALRKANQKFDARFREVENLAEKPLDTCSLAELEAYWQKAKEKVAHKS